MCMLVCSALYILSLWHTGFFKKNSHLMLATLQHFRNPRAPTSKLYCGFVQARLQKKQPFVFQPRATRKQHWERGAGGGLIAVRHIMLDGCFFWRTRYVIHFVFVNPSQFRMSMNNHNLQWPVRCHESTYSSQPQQTQTEPFSENSDQYHPPLSTVCRLGITIHMVIWV